MKMPRFENPQAERMTRQEKVARLKESLAKKIDYIVETRKKIGESDMSIEDLQSWVNEQAISLSELFPDEVINIKKIKELSVQIHEIDKKLRVKEQAAEELSNRLDDKGEVLGEKDSISGALDDLQQKVNELYEEINNEYSTQGALIDEREFLIRNDETLFYNGAIAFSKNLLEKREMIDSARVSYEEGDMKTFLDELGVSPFSSLRSYVQEKTGNLDVEFLNQDVLIYVTKEETEESFDGKKNGGWHYANTPVSIIRKDSTDIDYIVTHEKGHNLAECTESEGVHQVKYFDELGVKKLQNSLKRFRSLNSFMKNETLLKNEILNIKKTIRSQIKMLTGEISADIENLVEGRISGFFGHFSNTIKGLDTFLVDVKNQEKDLFPTIKESVEQLTEEASGHVRELLFMSNLAKKFDISDKFLAAVLMSPHNTRLVRRVLQEELGDRYFFEATLSGMAPEYSLPDGLHTMIYKLSTKNITARLFDLSVRSIDEPKGYVQSENDDSRYRSYGSFANIFAHSYEVNISIPNPQNLKRFLSIVDQEKMDEIDELSKKRIIKTLQGSTAYECVDSILGKFMLINKPIDIVDYGKNIIKLYDFFDIPKERDHFVENLFSSSFYNFFLQALEHDDPQSLRDFVELWDLSDDKYVFNEGDIYGSVDIEYVMDSIEVNDVLKDKILNRPEETKVYKYIRDEYLKNNT
jgi:hypothetical protein